MKYLSDYIEKAQTECFSKHGVFFAFSTKQYNEKAKKGILYKNIPMGMFCPAENIRQFMEEMKNIEAKGVRDDLIENGILGVINREFGNYEVQFDDDLSRVYDALKNYPIDKKTIKSEYPKYYQKCIDNDWF